MAVAQIHSPDPGRLQESSRPGPPTPAARIKLVPGGNAGPIADGGPVWLELYLEIAEVSEAEDRKAYRWFEGSASPWGELPRPVVAWDEVAKSLSGRGLRAPDPDTAHDPDVPDATRALALLPHLYSLGTNRVVQELLRKGGEASVNGVEPDMNGHEPTGHGLLARVFGARENGSHAGAGPSGNGSAASQIELFPLVGFHPFPGASRRLEFRTLRTNVAVIGETIVTVRLPDLPCPPAWKPQRGKEDPPLSQEERRTEDPLEIPSRFFPCWDARATDFAEEIARHQAATGRALSDEVRKAMEPCTEHESGRLRKPRGRSEPGAPVPDEQKLDDLVHLGEVAEVADRQLSRVLRRLGSFGQEAGDGAAAQGLAALSDIRRRYHYAVDEIRTLEKELDSARVRLRTHMETRFQATVAFAGSAILIPTLVAGIFGANVWLPGERHTEGLFALLLFIVAFAAGRGAPPHPPRGPPPRP